jgi:hypothetical protein
LKQVAYNVDGLLLCRNFMIVSPELKPIEKPKYKIYSIVHLRSVSRNRCSITNKKLIKCTSRPAIANAM